jgi:glycosyltransferase involved in cell wall biosynthesis
MRMLYVCLDRGVPIGGAKGASVHVAELLRALDAEGHTTAVLARAFEQVEDERTSFLAPASLGLRWIPGRILRRDLRELVASRRFRDALREAIRDFRPDVVYERYALFRDEALAEAKRAGIPHVLEVNAPLAFEERRFRGIVLRRAAERAERRVWRRTDLLVSPSRALSERARAFGQERVLVLPNAVDPARFAGAKARRDEVRRSLALDDRFVVGFAGSLKPWHDLGTLVAAVSRLPAELPPALLLVGEGPERARLERQASSAGVRLALSGAVPHAQVGEFLVAMDVCFAGLPPDPDYRYFSPLKALEYLAAGRPAVVAEAGDLEPLVDAGVAVGYPPGDARRLAEQLARVARDAPLREQLEKVGPRYARSRTWRRAAAELVQAAERIAPSRSNA